MPDILPCLEIETAKPAAASIIWLHGLGADGHDFEPIIPELKLPQSLAVRFIFPHAPTMPVSINGGFSMPAWYDIKGDNIEGRQDQSGIHQSAQAIQQLIEHEKKRGIPAERIILAGFSQGGAMALYVGLRQPQALAGILGLSCYTLLPDEQQSIQPCPQTPIQLAHGIDDDIVPLALGEASLAYLQQQQCKVAWQTYPMAHSLCPAQIQHIGQWITTCLQP
ncbi:MAG: alpha/beta hydrolase fold domain-containing protein [Mariprofundaceae bacterium]|nr:alpha/beta hydrolase fold domain-containing protein [Mariprofundaceae bacterium]